MKSFYLLTALLFICNAIYSQNLEFVQGPPLPQATGAVASAVHGNDIYLVSGFTPTEPYSSKIYKFDGDLQEWSLFTDDSVPKRFASAEVIGDSLFVYNGMKDGGIIS